MQYRTLWADGLAGQRDRLRDVGPGGLDRLGRRRDAGRARAGRRAGLQLLRHGLGLRQRPQRADCSAAWSAPIPDKELYVATKIPPKNFKWPSRRGFTLDDCFPPDHIREYAEKSLANLGLPRIDLLQFHVWEDAWAHDERWQRAIDDLKRQGLIRAVGISVNRWEPDNVLETLRTGLIDAVQVIYNIFDQAPAGRAVPALPRAERRRDRPRSVRRGDAHRHADQGDAAGPRATGATATSCRRTSPRASTAPRPSGRSCPPG